MTSTTPFTYEIMHLGFISKILVNFFFKVLAYHVHLELFRPFPSEVLELYTLTTMYETRHCLYRYSNYLFRKTTLDKSKRQLVQQCLFSLIIIEISQDQLLFTSYFDWKDT